MKDKSRRGRNKDDGDVEEKYKSLSLWLMYLWPRHQYSGAGTCRRRNGPLDDLTGFFFLGAIHLLLVGLF